MSVSGSVGYIGVYVKELEFIILFFPLGAWKCLQILIDSTLLCAFLKKENIGSANMTLSEVLNTYVSKIFNSLLLYLQEKRRFIRKFSPLYKVLAYLNTFLKDFLSLYLNQSCYDDGVAVVCLNKTVLNKRNLLI